MILITNDDGFLAKGITEAAAIARQFDDVVIVAPDQPRSGQSNALTVNMPIVYTKVRTDNNLTLYTCTGTPVDCVKLAFSGEIDGLPRPSLLISGINHGSNASINVLYSGTIGAAIEGSLYGVPSIGLSLCNHDLNADFVPVRAPFAAIVRDVIEHGLPQGIALNVNAPKGDIRGVRVCRQARGKWSQEFMASPTPRGYYCYWLTGDFSNVETEATDTDQYALDCGYISVQPIHTDMTHYPTMETLQYLKRN